MRKKIAAPITLNLRGVDYMLMFDFDAVASAEDISGKSLITGITSKDVMAPPVSLVRAMLYASLLPIQPEITFSQAKAMVTRDNLVDVWMKVLEVWNAHNPDPETVEADPTTAQG